MIEYVSSFLLSRTWCQYDLLPSPSEPSSLVSPSAYLHVSITTTSQSCCSPSPSKFQLVILSLDSSKKSYKTPYILTMLSENPLPGSTWCSSAECEQEIQDLKSELLEFWKQSIALHQENQRLQSCLDIRDKSIKSLKEKNRRLKSTILGGSILPATPGPAKEEGKEEEGEGEKFGRYRFEERGFVIGEALYLNLEPVYFSEPELASDPAEYAKISKPTIASNLSASKQKAVGKKVKGEREGRGRKKRNGRGGIDVSMMKGQEREPFVMEISDPEASTNAQPTLKLLAQSGKKTQSGQGSAVQRLARGPEQHKKSNTCTPVATKRKLAEEEEDCGPEEVTQPRRWKRFRKGGGSRE
ncbi:hypothetical protein TWF730_009232 [Orbilia blumenaviensis]|uniref:Uncharacterized protein n=1 Tax=Orbilia blumenaviensis TaxID=1796055 RepID=A0AAV9V016_9PEZI